MHARTSTTRRKPPAGGFTLLELIAVLLLISTVLAIAAPSLRGFMHGRQTYDAAAQILALTRHARSQAAAQGCIHRLNIDPEESRYWLTRLEGGAYVELDTEFGARFALPTGATLDLATEDEGQVDWGDDAPYVPFYPDGRTDPVTIRLTGGEGDVLYITCPSASEPFEIVASTREDER